MIDKTKASLDKILIIIGLILVVGAILYDTVVGGIGNIFIILMYVFYLIYAVIGKDTKLIRIGLIFGSLIIIVTYVHELNLF